MNVAIASRRWKNTLLKVLNRVARSAASKPSAASSAASQTPGPVEAEVRAVVHEGAEGVVVRAQAQHGVAEVAWGERREVSIALGARAVRGFVEHEQLVLEADLRREAQALLALGQHTAQQRSWTERMLALVLCAFADELGDEVGRAVWRQGAFASSVSRDDAPMRRQWVSPASCAIRAIRPAGVARSSP